MLALKEPEQPIEPPTRAYVDGSDAEPLAGRTQLEVDQLGAKYKRKVRREEAEKAEQRKVEDEALRAMTPAEYDAWKKNVPAAIGLAPSTPVAHAAVASRDSSVGAGPSSSSCCCSS